MKPFKALPVVLALLITQLAGAQQNTLISHLPEHTSMVMSLNLFRIGSKIPKDSLLNSPLMQMKDKESPLMILNKLTTSGVSLGQDILIAFVPDAEESGKKPGMHVLGKLSDAGLFTKMVQDLFPNDTVKTYGTDQILFTKSGTLGWNKDLFVFSSASSHQRDVEASFFGTADTTADGKPAPSADQLLYEIRKEQRENCFRLLDGPVANGFRSDARFITHINTPGDLKMWNNGMMNPLMANLSPMVGMMKMTPGTARARSAVTNFENGRVVSESRTYMDPAISEQLKDYKPIPQNMDLIKKLPAGNQMLIMNMTVNKATAMNMKQPEQLKMIMDSLKKILPFEWEKLADVFGGSAMLAVTTDANPDPEKAKNPFNGMHLFIAMPIADKAKYDELAVAVIKLIDSLKGTEGGEKMLKGFKPAIKATNDLFVLGLKPEDVEQYVNNPATGPVPEWITSQAAHPMSMQFDFKELVSMIMKTRKGGKSEDGPEVLFNAFRDIVMTGGDFDNGAITTRMEYRFMNTEQNSLQQLINMIGKLASDKGKHTDTDAPAISQDEPTNIPPPPPPKQKSKTPSKGKTKTKQ